MRLTHYKTRPRPSELRVILEQTIRREGGALFRRLISASQEKTKESTKNRSPQRLITGLRSLPTQLAQLGKQWAGLETNSGRLEFLVRQTARMASRGSGFSFSSDCPRR